jgi:O-antigen/teichoic acid export membrane protein
LISDLKSFSSPVGLLALAVAGALLLLAVGFVAVIKLYPRGADSTLQRLAKNSVFPMATSLLSRLLDMAFAMYWLRILGTDGTGSYAFAVVVLGYLDIVANFGLGTLLTREVARDREAANRYLGNTLVTRIGLWVLAMVMVGVLLGPLSGPLDVTPDVGLAILLFAVGLLPSLASGTLSALFQAYEKFEYPATVTVLTTVLKIALSVIVLESGMGFVGMAGVSVVVNVATLAILFGFTLAVLFRPRPEFELRFSLQMLRTSYPLMLNSLLNSLFFRVDSVMLKPMAGNDALGYYSTAYKFIDGLGIISSSFTLAIFPLLSQYAQSSREMLARTFGFAIKLLMAVSLPICVGTTLIAPEIILVFGGSKFLPHSAIALQILIWFLPFSFVNGVTQYLLIAINQQRFITFSFAIAAAFNLATNLLLIPSLGYVGAAITTVVSEWVLMVPFWYCVRQHLPPVPLARLTWRPALASAIMGLEVWLLQGVSLPAAVALAPVVYGAGLLALRTFEQEEMAMLGKSLPWRRT